MSSANALTTSSDASRALRFSKLLRIQQFWLVVITGTAPQAAAIRASVANQHWPEGLAVHLSVVSDLFPSFSETFPCRAGSAALIRATARMRVAAPAGR